MKEITTLFFGVMLILFTPKSVVNYLFDRQDHVQQLVKRDFYTDETDPANSTGSMSNNTIYNNTIVSGNATNATAANATANATSFVNEIQLAVNGTMLPAEEEPAASHPYFDTQGFKVIDFLQACYMPTNLSSCGVNVPVLYLTDGTIGTPPQAFQSLIDINSYETHFSTCDTLSDCPVSKSRNLYQCVYPSYEGNISFSFNYANTTFVSNFINSGSIKSVEGCWGWDNVTFGGGSSSYRGIDIPYFQFPVVNPPSDAYYYQGVLGLGMSWSISRNNFISDKQRNQYYNSYTANYSNSLLDTMKVYRQINSKVYSMWVDDEGKGQLIIGAINSGKIAQGYNLTIYQDIQTKYFPSFLNRKKFNIYRPYLNIDYISLDGLNNYKKKLKSFKTYDAIIESTERSIYGPKEIIKSFAKNYDLKNKDNRYYMNCSKFGQPLEIVFAQNLNISIPWEDLKFKNLDPMTNKKPDQDCVWALNYKNKQDYWVLGQTFLNNVYFYSDLENGRLGLAPVNRTGPVKWEIQTIE